MSDKAKKEQVMLAVPLC